MKHRPLIIKLTAAYLLFLPIALGIYFKYLLATTWETILQLYFTRYGLLILPLYFVAYGIWRVRSWGYYCFMIMAVVVVAVDSYHSFSNYRYPTVWMLFDAALAVLGVLLFQQRRIREPYFNPSIRWWERGSRHRVDIPAEFVFNDVTVKSPLLDVSETGCFADFSPRPEVGQLVHLKFVFQEMTFECDAIVMRHAIKPLGIGLRFTKVNFSRWLNIRRLMRALKKFERQSRQSNSDSNAKGPSTGQITGS